MGQFSAYFRIQQRNEELIPHLVKMIRVNIHVLTSSGKSVLNDDEVGS